MTDPVVPRALGAMVTELRARGRSFALVGGLAVSARGEVRFTRDVDLAVVVRDDADAERLVHELRDAGYVPIASVEHEARKRLSTMRMMSPDGTCRSPSHAPMADRYGSAAFRGMKGEQVRTW